VVQSYNEPGALAIWDSSFKSIADEFGLRVLTPSAKEAEISEAFAAQFILALLRERPTLRHRFPHALSNDAKGNFCGWLSNVGRRKYGLSERALKKIRGAFRRRLGERIYELYLNEPELQRLYRFGLLPFHQRYFLQWLTTHGRVDQQVTDEQILWFLEQSAADIARGVALTYLLDPTLQEQFPSPFTIKRWKTICSWVTANYPVRIPRRQTRRVPPALIRARPQPLPHQEWAPSSKIEGVNVLSHFCNPSGIQQAAIWTKTALERAGVATSCRDVPVPRATYPIDRRDWLGLEVFPITILTHAGTPYFQSAYERSGLFRRPNVHRIAYWAWELEAVPDEWVMAASLVDEIWSPTEFVAQAMRARIPLPVHRMLPGVEVEAVTPLARARFGIPEDHCVFLFMFDLHSQIHRKNPIGVIRAFENAFRADERVTLLIKASGGDMHPKDLAELERAARGSNVVLVHEMFSRAAAYGLIAMCDCYVSLHRSEGFGLGMAEAMLLGKPVIATGYSGNLDFMTRDNSMLVDYQMVEITEDRPLYTKGNRWAEPSIDHASEYLRHVYQHREEAAALAARVQPEIANKLSLKQAGQRMQTRLQEIINTVQK
jgi:glycosyltransferase involved in cell wall biosynthesis